MRNLTIKIIGSLIALGVILGAIFFLNREKEENNTLGNITIEVLDINNNLIVNDSLPFTKDDDLLSLLEANYELVLEDGPYGKTLLGIAGIITDFKSTYLAIYLNDKYANKGISSITLEDNLKISFRELKI